MNIDNLNQYMSIKRRKFRLRVTDRNNYYSNRGNLAIDVKLSNLCSGLDPLSDERVDFSGNWDLIPSGHCTAYQSWMELDYDETHFWYRAVYRLVHDAFDPMNVAPCNGLEKFYEHYINTVYGEFCSGEESNSWRSPSRALFNEDSGKVYLLVSGGGPIDGLSVGDISTMDTMIDDAMRRISNSDGIPILDRANAHLPVTMVNFFDEVVPVTVCNATRNFAKNKFGITGESLIKPTGSKGYIEAEAVLSKDRLNKLLTKLEWDVDALRIKVKQYSSRYNQYLGWIPDDLSNVLFTTDKFSMVRVDKEPRPIFSSEIMDRYLNKRFDFSACVDLLYRGKKYSVDPGVYFMNIDNIERLSMIEYDKLISEILGDITLLAVSSRSQAIINTSGTIVSDKIKTSITARELSTSTGDDSGFIARPTARKLGL
jgi:hypothetical protein